MPEIEIMVKGYQCSRCAGTWVPRSDTRPLRCAKCGSPYWDREYERRP